MVIRIEKNSRNRRWERVLGLLALLVFWGQFLPESAWGEEPRRVLLLAQGPDGHPVAAHEYVAGLKIVKKCLDRVEGIQAEIVLADEPFRDGPQLLDKADGAVLYLSEGAKWLQQDPERLQAFDRLADRGGGLAVIHWGMGCRDAKYIDNFVRLFGACHGGPDRKYAVLTAALEAAPSKHAINAGFQRIELEDEFYFRLKTVKSESPIIPLLRVEIENESQMVAWGWDRPDRGRSFGFSGLHFHKNWEHESYRQFVVRGIAWTLKKPIPEAGFNVEISADDLRLPDR